MRVSEAELEQLRQAANCAVLLERLPPPWRLDKAESSRDSLKYRRGKGEVIIVNHGGRGWWDAGGTAKGDVFGLVRHLRPDLRFGQACRLLQRIVGLEPAFPAWHREKARQPAEGLVPASVRWSRARPIRSGTHAWRYLAGERRLPAAVLRAAAAADAVREGGYGTAWFAHRDATGALTGFDMRGPDYRGFAKGGDKTLFRFPGWPAHRAVRPRRLVVTEAPIDALSLAAIERRRGDTLYVATSGGMGPGTLLALDRLLAGMAGLAGAVLVAATDSDPAGERYAALLAERAVAAGVAHERLPPTGGLNDWNDVVRRGRGA
ncbi:DUF3991 and toprim domain-containing protein [Roseomonas sp. NAR14]|uniref:DUF3991 and toprim domain-containing protein n=1 Tax=Roseomonas acroporae TaxID=2937791 RepID=A0A9X2BZE9_9PROT|nr:DUF3991 and TOPRIM domain-containing protein [Roseomonas acroporae]MCK8787934.1 DUF3991 and toprim domain-containing protein [Roseomonas acroporae]